MYRISTTLSLLLVAGPALAGGFNLPLHGVRALSVGGAMFASADGADALFYNPALLNESSLALDLSMLHLAGDYTPADGVGGTIENSAIPKANPSIGAVWRITDWVSIGGGAYGPFGAQYKFPEDGPQRYALVENDESALIYMHLAAAFRIGPVSIGGGIQNVYGHIRQTTVLSGYSGLFGHAQDEELDILSELELVDPFTLSGNVGVAGTFGPVRVGISAQMPFTIEGQADFRNRLPSSVFFDGATLEGDKAELSIPFPLIVSAGVNWQIFDSWQVEVGLRWEDWSVQQEIVIDPQGQMILHGVPGVGDYVMKRIVLDRKMKDTWSVHAGTDYEVIEGLHLRGGLFWESSAFGDSTYSVSLMDDDKLGLAMGASYWVGPVRLDMGLSFVYQGERTVDGSTLEQVNPTNPDQAVIVGNGTYNANYFAGGIGLAWSI